MHLESLIRDNGGVASLAERLGQKRTTVAMWRRRGFVPARHIPAVARLLDLPFDAAWRDFGDPSQFSDAKEAA